MKNCNWKEYVCLLEKEISELVDYEVHHCLTHKGEATMHYLMENYKHAKEMLRMHGGGHEMGEMKSQLGSDPY